jgi:hypothetical protein
VQTVGCVLVQFWVQNGGQLKSAFFSWTISATNAVVFVLGTALWVLVIGYGGTPVIK